MLPLPASSEISTVVASVRKHEAGRFFLFGLSGVPVFLLSLGINVLLVENARWPKPLAYLLVIWVQMTSGFLIAHLWVFRSHEQRPLLAAYLQWALSMSAIRVADWSCYTALVEWTQLPYLVAQLGTAIVFIVVKFLSARAIFRSNNRIST